MSFTPEEKARLESYEVANFGALLQELQQKPGVASLVKTLKITAEATALHSAGVVFMLAPQVPLHTSNPPQTPQSPLQLAALRLLNLQQRYDETSEPHSSSYLPPQPTTPSPPPRLTSVGLANVPHKSDIQIFTQLPQAWVIWQVSALIDFSLNKFVTLTFSWAAGRNMGSYLPSSSPFGGTDKTLVSPELARMAGRDRGAGGQSTQPIVNGIRYLGLTP
ncbi:hypothetical protein DM02DRAFT_394867 [Periconia macrospinosa]|uniref:Uncharacterized protein n=1 Tax=Periconia macrospinosa TaxID=97972 RepID=A0A2V1DR70_9PLEO|nr:hypothetical protein DM02DRAFT_394867 [Periconia macrospinosa]